MKRNRENRHTLNDSEIEHFGFKATKERRYRLSNEQLAELEEMRTKNSVPKDDSQPFVLNAWNKETGKMMDIEEYCDSYNLPRHDIKDYKLITHTGTPYYNIKFKDKEVDLEEVDLKEVINSLISKEPYKPVENKKHITCSEKSIDRLIFTDTHVGLDTNSDGNSLYSTPWGEDELMDRASAIVEHMVNSSLSDVLVIDDLGDLMDGWDGFTTRGGHKLPQNMSNKEAFEAAVTFKMFLLGEASTCYEKVVMHNICNDNHSGSFAEIVNHTVKMLAFERYDNVVVENIHKFIDHYFINDYCFILTHGKDNKNLKFGFKPVMDGKQLEKIDQYIKNNGIYNKCKYIEFSKGDSHQALFDMCSSDDFDYFNYPALSPSSEWVQVNFKKGRSGFTWQHIQTDTGIKETTPIFFK